MGKGGMASSGRLDGRNSMLGQGGCFAWLWQGICAPTQTIAGDCWGSMSSSHLLLKRCTQFTIQEQHRAMSPVGCVGNLPRLKIAHMLSGCSALAQSKYMHRKCSMESLLLRDCAGTGANWHGSSLVFACSVQTNLRVTWGTSTSSPRQTEWILNLWTTRL